MNPEARWRNADVQTIPSALPSGLASLLVQLRSAVDQIPYALIAFLGRFALAAVFWNSGQTKIEGLAINLVDGTFQLGWPKLADSAVALFREEYQLPLIDPTWAASAAALAEHGLPILLLFGLGTRFAALGLLIMTTVIQVLVYPGAYATHATWAAVLLMLLARGPGYLALDTVVARRLGLAVH